jgi:hypothetical protein
MSATRHVVAALLGTACVIGAAFPAAAQTGLSFNGSTQYVTFGPAADLNATSFTVETWFMRTAAGVTTSTGTGGWANIVPLVTKGRAEAETPANLNMNYFLGIRSDNKLAADCEETSGPNHPIGGVTAIALNTWYHAAITYNATTGRYTLYLNGAVEKDTTMTPSRRRTPASARHWQPPSPARRQSSGSAGQLLRGRLDGPASGTWRGRNARSSAPDCGSQRDRSDRALRAQ